MSDATPSTRLLLQALIDPSPEVAAAAGRSWLDAVDVQLIGHEQGRMLPMLYKRLHALGVDQPDLLRGTYRKTWTQNQLRFRSAAAFFERLQADGVPTLVLKGAALIPAYGGDWGLRDMSDVDILVQPKHLDRALALLASEGWTGERGVRPGSVGAHLADHRHSWNFARAENQQVDLHWHVFATSRGRTAEAAFWSAAVALELGPTRTMRFCDGDLLLHLLEHASHDEVNSRVQWMVDVVMLLRSTSNIAATASRAAEQAASHDLLPTLSKQVELLAESTDDPCVEPLAQALRRQPRQRRRVLAEHRRGAIALAPALRSTIVERFDPRLADRPAARAVYVASGRRAVVERLLRRGGGPLAKPLGPATEPDADGWWDLSQATTVDAVCGPGWSYPDAEYGVWSHGPEARLVLPTRGATTLEVDLLILPRLDGPPRSVEVRVDGRFACRFEALADFGDWQTLDLTLPPARQVEIAFIIRRPGRPIDLGLSADTRELGVLVRRLRFA